MAELRKSVMSGIVFLNASTVSFIQNRAGQVLTSRANLPMVLPMRPAASSISSTWMHVCAEVCVVFVCVCIYIYICVYVHVCVCECMFVFVCVCECECGNKTACIITSFFF